jgi:outer membrane receptor for ferrienterochelin and colicins
MKKIIGLCWCMAIMAVAQAQHTIRVVVKDHDSKEPIAGATLLLAASNGLTNKSGFTEFANLPPGLHRIKASHAGYQDYSDTLRLPRPATDTLEILLVPEEEELGEVIVQSTRTSRTIKNTPTRVETIDGEELDEKNNMRPANVAMLLHESTGIQVQQTSATSANANIRMQGLDGRYTQLLKDGYPSFGNFANGLSILEIPPLDLAQVEVIKGPASVLYGGGAIAGVVNFISKTPQPGFSGNFILNQSHIGQRNLGGYVSQRKGRWGFSLLGLANFQKEYDVDNDNFSELPYNRNFTITPRLFYFGKNGATLMLGNSYTQSTNIGGDMRVIAGNEGPTAVYFEKNNTRRNTTMLEWDKRWARGIHIKLKQGLAIFNRQMGRPNYRFEGRSLNSFTDWSLMRTQNKQTWVMGLNVVVDRFVQKGQGLLDATVTTGGGYIQHTWDINSLIKLESGLRAEHLRYKGQGYDGKQFFVLPRVSALFNLSNQWSSRVGVGWGYKAPTIFTEQTEQVQYQSILPLVGAKAEQSFGGTADVNYRVRLANGLAISWNQLFFYTSILRPLVLQTDVLGNRVFANAARPVTSYGWESNLKFIYRQDLKLFVGYTFTQAEARYLSGNPLLPLQPRHKLNLALLYEKEGKFKYLYNGSATPSFWELGFMAQKDIGKLALFINFENFTDQRQSRYKGVVNPTFTNPSFDDIWNHVEGFVMNGGIKLKL